VPVAACSGWTQWPATAGEQAGDEGLQVGAGGLGQVSAVGLKEGGEPADADQVAGHGAVGEVLGAQVPLEGAGEAGGGAASMAGP
jgi:hypothetical protein